LIAKIQRHDVWSMIRPPASGPAMTAIPPHAVQDPIAAPRSRSENGGDDRQRVRCQQRAGYP
jgi:hypothetical protein